MERPRLSCKGKGASAVRQDGRRSQRRWRDAAPEASLYMHNVQNGGAAARGCFPDPHGTRNRMLCIKYFFA